MGVNSTIEPGRNRVRRCRRSLIQYTVSLMHGHQKRYRRCQTQEDLRTSIVQQEYDPLEQWGCISPELGVSRNHSVSDLRSGRCETCRPPSLPQQRRRASGLRLCERGMRAYRCGSTIRSEFTHCRRSNRPLGHIGLKGDLQEN